MGIILSSLRYATTARDMLFVFLAHWSLLTTNSVITACAAAPAEYNFTAINFTPPVALEGISPVFLSLHTGNDYSKHKYKTNCSSLQSSCGKHKQKQFFST